MFDRFLIVFGYYEPSNIHVALQNFSFKERLCLVVCRSMVFFLSVQHRSEFKVEHKMVFRVAQVRD